MLVALETRVYLNFEHALALLDPFCQSFLKQHS